MTVLRDVLARFGIEVDSSPLENLDRGIGSVVDKLGELGQTLAAGFAANQLADFVNATVEAADDLGDLSERLDVNTDSLQAWGFAAQLSGLDAESMAGSLGFLQRNLANATTGNATARTAFRSIGVAFTDAEGRARDLDAVLLDVAGAVAATEDPARQTAIATSLFGRSGAALVPMLARGTAGLAELRAEYVRLGGGASRQMIERASELADQQARLDVVTYSLRTRIVNLLLPALLEGAQRTLDFASSFLTMADNSHILGAAIVTVGAIAVGAGIATSAAWLGPVLVFGLVALAVAFIILLVDDLITLFSGGTSVIGSFLDEIFGIGTAAETVQYLTDAWNGLTTAIGEAADAVTGFFGLDAGSMLGDETITNTRGTDSASGISVEEDNMRVIAARAMRGEDIDPREAVAAATALRERNARVAVSTPGSVGRAVTISSPVTINVPAGTTPPESERLRRVVTDVLDERNRTAAAAIAEEAEGG